MNIANYAIVLCGVLLNAIAQIFLKLGAERLNWTRLAATHSLVLKGLQLINGYIFAGLACYAVSVVIWIIVLRRMELSVAYPFLSIGFILSVFAGYFVFGEQITSFKVLGIILICLGVICISRA